MGCEVGYQGRVSFSTGNPAFLILVATALADREASSTSVNRSNNSARRLIVRGGVSRQPLELPAHRRQAELPQLRLEQLDRDIGHRQDPS